MAVFCLDATMGRMTIDGRQIAEEIFEEIKQSIAGKEISLSVFIVGNDPATESFVRIKKQKAAEVGISLKEIRFGKDVTEEELTEAVQKEAGGNHPIVVQLPLPKHIQKRNVLDAIPEKLDVDVLSSESMMHFGTGKLDVFPPVIGAVKEVLERTSVDPKGKEIVVIGKGALVGLPAEMWFKQIPGTEVSVADSSTEDLGKLTKNADILLSGVGIPGLIQPNMIRDDSVLLDAGTSEAAGMLRGDIAPACAEKAAVYTPVPGGIGPITVAILLRNTMTKALS